MLVDTSLCNLETFLCLKTYLVNDDYIPQDYTLGLSVQAFKNMVHWLIFCIRFCFVLPMFVQACQLLLQQQNQPQQQQQHQLLQNQRKFAPNVRQQADPQQVHTSSTTLTSLLLIYFLFSSHDLFFFFCHVTLAGQDYGGASAAKAAAAGWRFRWQLQTFPLPPWRRWS